MTTYRIQMMTTEDYANYMGGSYYYNIKTINVNAETADEAIAIAKVDYPEMIINKGYVKSVEEIAEMEAEAEARRTAREKAEAEKAEKKANREVVKAEEMGMTIEEYKAYKKAVANAKRHEAEIKKAKEMIAEMKRKIAYEEKKVAEYKKEIEKMMK